MGVDRGLCRIECRDREMCVGDRLGFLMVWVVMSGLASRVIECSASAASDEDK